MPAMNRFRIFRLPAQSAERWHPGIRFVHALLFAALTLVGIAPAFAQNRSAQNTPGIFIKGRVRDVAGASVPDATVVLQEKARSASVESKTGPDGTFAFLALRAGTYTVRVKKEGFCEAVGGPMELAPGQKEQIDVVLKIGTANDAALNEKPCSSKAPGAIEFADKPNFTVAGITDWSNIGLHGSDTNARTSESLAKDTVALKSASSGSTTPGLAAKSEEAEAHRALGDRYEKSGDPLAAVREYESAARLDPNEQNYFNWGVELLLHRAIQPAIEVFTKGAGAHPNSARILAGLGAALYASGSFEDAARRLCQASDLKPAEMAPYLFLGKMQKAATDPLPGAEEKLARFAHEQPGNALANYYYSIALWKRTRGSENSADLQTQEALLEKALTIDPKLAEAHLQLGILYFAQKRFETAIRAYKKAIEVNPNLGETHYRLGLAYKRIGEESNAEREFKTYKQIAKEEADAAERERKELQQFVILLH
jgi:tetratricopeptide (TPR) repeat protein